MNIADSPNITSPVLGTFSGQSSRSRSSTKLVDDVTSLTSFNPFSEEDENDQSSYTLVTSIFSRMKNTLSAPLSSAVAVASNSTIPSNNGVGGSISGGEQKRPSYTLQTHSSFSSRTSAERPNPLLPAQSQAAPPLVSLTPAQSEVPTYNLDYDRSPSRSGTFYSPGVESGDGGLFGTAIPGFPIQDDARSIKTTTSLHRSGSVSKVIRRIRGEGRLKQVYFDGYSNGHGLGLSRDYWMDDENCKECYDCKSVFTTWRRKHHCRICGNYTHCSELYILTAPHRSNILLSLRLKHHQRFQIWP